MGTTKPYHDSRELARLGDITTPWPAFMIACRTNLLNDCPDMVEQFLDAVTSAQDLFVRNEDHAVQYVVDKHGNTEVDARAWFQGLEYANKAQVSPFVLDGCMTTLVTAGVIQNRVPVERLCGP